MWELQTVFERQNETPFGILWLGKQLVFILDVSVCECVCIWMKGRVGKGLIPAWFGQREQNTFKGNMDCSINPT